MSILQAYDDELEPYRRNLGMGTGDYQLDAGLQTPITGEAGGVYPHMH
jgi:hypothetical protein